MRENLSKIYGMKDELVYLFGVNKHTLSNDLTVMRRLPEFTGAIPSRRTKAGLYLYLWL